MSFNESSNAEESEWVTVKSKVKSNPKNTSRNRQQSFSNQQEYQNVTNPGQDWKDVVLKKYTNTNKLTKADVRKGNFQIVRKKHQDQSQRLHKIDNETENLEHKKIDRKMSQNIQQARVERRLNRKELAQKINLKPDIIASYENGSAILDPIILRKIRNYLKI